ncbi:MAG: hypothetical protein IKS31_01355 [Clostridia bacterium]|nr:hypothetical protein [Clostridia bacterium]
MTINEVTNRVQNDRPGESTDAEMIKWLSQMDSRWADEVVRTHCLPQPEEQEILFMPSNQGERTIANVTYTVTGRETVIDGTGSWTGRRRAWSAKVKLFAGRTYDLLLDEKSGSYETGNVPALLQIWRNDTKISEAQPDEGVELTVEETGEYTITLDVIQGSYDTYKLYAQLTGPVSAADFDGYPENVDRAAELLIGEPDDEIYLYWLYSRIDLRLGEIERYNADAALFNTAWNEAAKRYNRHNMPRMTIIHRVAYGDPVPYTADEDPLNQRRGW